MAPIMQSKTGKKGKRDIFMETGFGESCGNRGNESRAICLLCLETPFDTENTSIFSVKPCYQTTIIR